MKRFFTWIPTLVLVIICSFFLLNSPSYAFNKADLDQLLQKRSFSEFKICDHCDLSNANLTGADLSRAELIGADLSYADMSDADFTGAILRNTRY